MTAVGAPAVDQPKRHVPVNTADTVGGTPLAGVVEVGRLGPILELNTPGALIGVTVFEFQTLYQRVSLPNRSMKNVIEGEVPPVKLLKVISTAKVAPDMVLKFIPVLEVSWAAVGIVIELDTDGKTETETGKVELTPNGSDPRVIAI